MRAAPSLILCVLAVTAVGCSSTDNTLAGSLSEVYNLTFEGVRARLYTSELSIEYVDRYAAVPVRVTLRLAEVEPAADHTYDLAEVGDISGRLPSDTEIPRFTDGTLALGDYLAEPDADVSGSFDAKFATGRDTLSLSGSFQTTLEVVGGQ